VSHALYGLLGRLESVGIHFTLGRYRPDSILVALTLVGERVEIDVFDDGHMEVSRFKGGEDIMGDAASVDQIIQANSD
jgi:hypothetical protein